MIDSLRCDLGVPPRKASGSRFPLQVLGGFVPQPPVGFPLQSLTQRSLLWIVVVLITSCVTGSPAGGQTNNDATMQPSTAGLTAAQLDSVEAAIGKKLPVWYRNFLTTYPEDLVTLGAPYNTVSELSLPNTVQGIIRVNYVGQDVPQNILYIGTNGSGDDYYVILDRDDGTIRLTKNDWPTYLDDARTEVDWEKSYTEKFDDIHELVDWLRDNLK